MLPPKFKDHLHIEIVPPDKVFVIAEFGQFVLTGRSSAAVASLVDGTRETEDIISALHGEVSAGQVRYVLALMETRGYIDEAIPGVPRSASAYWHSLGVSSRAASTKTRDPRLEVRSFGNPHSAECLAFLAQFGFNLDEGGSDRLQLVLTDNYLRPELEEINRQSLRDGRPWMLVRPVGTEFWLGPLFVPNSTGCWACLAERLRDNREVEAFLQQHNQRSEPYCPVASLSSTIGAAIAMASTEVLKWLASGKCELEGRVVSMNTANLHTTQHALVRRPQCPACGDGHVTEPRPLVLRECRKKSTLDGGHRAESAEGTLQRLKRHVSPITGIVKNLERITSPDDPLQHVYTSGQNMARKTDSYLLLRKNLRSSSCGKGVSDTQAQVSAIGEAIERYSGVFRGDEPRKRASFRELGDAGLDPRDCMLFSEEQYRRRYELNAHGSFFNTIPLPLDEDAQLDWTPLWSLTRQEFRYLPTSYCYYSYPMPENQFFVLPDSNGNAAGNTAEEAILQGLLELVERDGVALWWYNRIRRRALDLESFDEPYVQHLRDYHRSRHRDLWVLDLTTDFEIPVFIALSRRTDRQPEDIVFAPAAHLDPRIALLRALTELNQMMPAMDDQLEPGNYLYDDQDAVAWWRTATLENQPYLVPSGELHARRGSEFPNVCTDDLREDILYCKALLESKGHELLVLDQTRPDIELRVLKVVSPGLRHFWSRLAPGRLYDVPLRSGWVSEALTEQQMNPISLFI